MKHYKLFLIGAGFFVLGIIVMVTYVDMPAPSKLENVILDVYDEAVR